MKILRSKVLSQDELMDLIAEWRSSGQTVAFTNGVFDILHTGHLLSFEQASQFADRLIVAVNSDSSVRTLGKGDGRPFNSQDDRARLIVGFAVVDAVVVFNESTPCELLSKIRPDVLVKGADYRVDQIVGREFAGRVERITLEKGRSTTELVRRMRELPNLSGRMSVAIQKNNILTKRLQLRPFELSDGHRVRDLAGDKAIADTTLNIPHPYEDGMAEQWIATHAPQFQSGESANFAIVMRYSQELIGAIGLSINKRFNRAELGYWVGKEYWNQGYCTEAAKAMLEYGFQELNLHKIYAHRITRNPASGKVIEKIGMIQEGVLREHVIKYDKYEDIISYSVLKSELNSKS